MLNTEIKRLLERIMMTPLEKRPLLKIVYSNRLRQARFYVGVVEEKKNSNLYCFRGLKEGGQQLVFDHEIKNVIVISSLEAANIINQLLMILGDVEKVAGSARRDLISA